MTDKLKLAMAASKLLTEARDFIKDRDHWVRGSLFADFTQREANESLAQAPRVCAIGAVMKAANLGVDHYRDISPEEHREAFEALRILADAIEGRDDYRELQEFYTWDGDIHHFNDDHASHAQIVAAFDKAIEHQCSVVCELALQVDQTELRLDGQKDNAS